MGGHTLRACQVLRPDALLTTSAPISYSCRRLFHDYFVTHLPSSSLHPDSRSSAGSHHQLPRAASKPHTPHSKDPSPAPLAGVTRDTTVVRIPLRSAKHHFGVSLARGTRPYNEDSYQAGVIELPAFAKRAPVSLKRAPASSPLQAYREGQRKQREQEQGVQGGEGEGTSAEGASGDPQVFYFGVFDGHGGAECSGFLRESLHEYIEDAAKKYELQSSLRESGENKGQEKESGRTPPVGEGDGENRMAAAGRKSLDDLDMKSPGTGQRSSSSSEESQSYTPPTAKEDTKPPLAGSPPLPQKANVNRASDLESSLIKGWRELVGGYFRRFKPAAFFIPEGETISISTILTYAFLRADLDFISAQARKSGSDSDLVLADAPLNAGDILDSPSRQIGGPKRFKGGSTCSLALISTPSPTPFWHPASSSTLVVAHVGDTRIMLCRTVDGKAVPVTMNHHPSSPGEGERLRRYATSFVTDSFGEERMGGLANTRSFGDMQSKRLGVSAEPETRRIEMSPAQYSFMVLISDGVSGTLGDDEVVDIVKEARTPEQGAKDVVAFATEVSVEGDNATCLVVRLGGWERRSEGGKGSMETKEVREWRRQDATNPRSRMT
ncbi:hypothetical protein MMC24_003755 [Lignoscripta atroalba]|nr:hypothetical protein [Lignoscripta atroalba]